MLVSDAAAPQNRKNSFNFAAVIFVYQVNGNTLKYIFCNCSGTGDSMGLFCTCK